MRHSSLLTLAALLFTAILATLIYGCAHQVSPEGGPYDMMPPKLVKATPPNGAVNVKKRTIKLRFNENVRLEKQSEKVVAAPPQLEPPRFTAGVGKTITIKIEEPLVPNTTYTFDFSDAIVDLNEGNPLEGFSYAFSTGPHIDTMQLRGQLLDAHTLMPLSAYTVGVYRDSLPDLPGDQPMLRISKTTDNGVFNITHLAPGKYFLVATNDIDRNYSYSQPNEGIAFLADAIEAQLPLTLPLKEQAATPSDSTLQDSTATAEPSPQLVADKGTDQKVSTEGAADSTEVATAVEPSPLPNEDESVPDNLLLYAVSIRKSQVLGKVSRPDSTRLTIAFHEPITQLPQLKPLFTYPSSSPAGWQPQLEQDKHTLSYYLTDSMLYQQDTLRFTISYAALDSLERPIVKEDSLQFVYKHPKTIEKGKTTSRKSKKKRASKKKVTNSTTDSTHLSVDSISRNDSTLIDSIQPHIPQLKVNLIREEGIHKGHPRAAVWLSFSEPVVLPDSIPIRLYSIAVDSASLAATDSIPQLDASSADAAPEPTQAPSNYNQKEKSYVGGASNPYENALDKYGHQAEQNDTPTAQEEDYSSTSGQSFSQGDKIPEGERTLIPLSLRQDSLRSLDYELIFDADFGAQYLLEIDSGSIESAYHSIVLKEQIPFATLKEDAFGGFKLFMEYPPHFNTDGAPCYFELLDKNDSVLLRQIVTDSLEVGELAPETYFGRIWLDLNKNGVWDMGKYPSEQPEPTYYLPQAISVQAKFTSAIKWNPLALPLYKQRPADMVHPEAKKQEETRERKNLNEEYIQRMRERYGERWNPGNRDRKLLGLPSRKEERAAKKAQRAQQKANNTK